jgi:hypothetical protein
LLPENSVPPEQIETESPATDVTTVETTSNADTKTILKDQAMEVKKAALDEPKFINYVLPAIIGLIIVLGFGSYWLIFRRKQI